MTRYLSQLEAIAARLRADEKTVALVIVPETQQSLLADLLSQLLERRHVVLDAASDVAEFVNCIVTLGSGSAISALGSVNSRRHWITDRGNLVFVISRNELQPLQQHAADMASVAQVAGRVSYEPATKQRSEAEDRRQLAAHYRSKFGTVDLRGFIRSEVEDASFALEAIFQPLKGTRWMRFSRELTKTPVTDHLPQLLETWQDPVVLVGTPGSGKSFFLRWCALNGSSMDSFLGIETPAPIYVSLAAFSLTPGVPTLREYVVDLLLADHLEVVDHLLTLEATGRLVFLLDGLDEAGDAPARNHVAAAVDALRLELPHSQIIATSRRSGLDDIDLAMDEISMEPLSSEGIRDLLTTWCALYERHRVGTPEAEQRGQREGAALAAEVLRSNALRGLASTPLLATIIAIVHRAGVQLPDHRAELYDHIVKILVERWNQVRSSTVRAAVPLRAADALRLLGPVALELIDSDSEGAVSEDTLRGMLERSLASGAVRGLGSAQEALEIFRRSLGLLVERAPGVYGFLHQTLIEFFGAQELVRTGRLESLCRDPREVFFPKWREVLLLSGGILGQLQANDQRLEQTVHALVWCANHRRGSPSPAVPSLLASFVADDPSLTSALVASLLEELVPKWWFAKRYNGISLLHVAQESAQLGDRIRRGRWAEVFRDRLTLATASIDVPWLLRAPGGASSFGAIVDALHRAGIEVGAVLCEAALAFIGRPALGEFAVWTLRPRSVTACDGETATARFVTTPGVARLLTDQGLRRLWVLNVRMGEGADSWLSTSQLEVQVVSELEADSVTVDVSLSVPPFKAPADPGAASVRAAILGFVPYRANASMTAALERAR